MKVPSDNEIAQLYNFLLSQGWKSFDQIFKEEGYTPYSIFKDACCFPADNGQLATPLLKEFKYSTGVFTFTGIVYYDNDHLDHGILCPTCIN